MPFETDTPKVLTSFLTYLNAVRSLSPATIHEYYLDLRTFFRFLKIKRGTADPNAPFEDIGIADVDIVLIRTVTLSDLYDFLIFLREKPPETSQKALQRNTETRPRHAPEKSLRCVLFSNIYIAASI